MAYIDCTCPTLSRNAHLQAQEDSQEFRGKGVQNVGKGGVAGGEDGEGKVGDVCGSYLGPMCKPFWPDWGPVQGNWWEARLGMAS